jgi:hypothetical protein
MEALSGWLRGHGLARQEWVQLLRTFNANAPAFKEESIKHD